METKTKAQKTVQEVGQEVLAYLNKTAKHLFITEDKSFFKVIPVRVNEKWYYVTIRFNGETCNMYVGDVAKKIEYHHECARRSIKDDLFPINYDKKISIPNFKLMREKTLEIVKLFQAHYIGNNDATMKMHMTQILADVKYTPKAQE